MEQASGRNDGVVVDFYLAGKLRGVADDAAVADDAVVSYMHVFHQQIAIADNSFSLRGSTATDGDILANGIVVTNLAGCFLTLELQVLRLGADRGAGEELVAVADTGTKMYRNVVQEFIVIANNNVLVYYAEGTDDVAVTQFGFRVYNC